MADAHDFPSRPAEPGEPIRAGGPSAGTDPGPVGATRLPPLLPRRQSPWILVDADGSPGTHGALVWALREAARREATVVAVCVLDEAEDDPLLGAGRGSQHRSATALERVEAQVLRAIAETGVHGRARTAVLDRPVFEALTGAARGADLVVVGGHGKSLLRHVVPRPISRRPTRGA